MRDTRLAWIEDLGEGVWTLSVLLAKEAHRLASPTPPEVRDGWAIDRALRGLEQTGLIEVAGRRVRLSEQGRRHGNGGVWAPEWWDRPWAGEWNCLIFDLPQREAGLRVRLHRMMRAARLGYLQQSVWIAPDQLPDLRRLEGIIGPGVGRLMTFSLRPKPGTSDREIVEEAWDIAGINEAYATWRQHWGKRPEPAAEPANAATFARWLREERALWLRAVGADPFLPRELYPAGYGGFAAWAERRRGWRLMSAALTRSANA